MTLRDIEKIVIIDGNSIMSVSGKEFADVFGDNIADDKFKILAVNKKNNSLMIQTI